MKRIKNIERILLYYHLRGDINIKNHIVSYDKWHAKYELLGYGLYHHGYYNGILKNDKIYNLRPKSLRSLYNDLKNNIFLKSLSIIIILKVPKTYQFNQNVLYGENGIELHFYYNKIISPTNLIVTRKL